MRELHKLWAGMTGVVLDWALNRPPPDGFLLCFGQVLDEDTPHQNLRDALIEDGFPYGDDGNGNPKLPDVRGRVCAGRDDLGGDPAGRLTTGGGGIDGTEIGATGGAETHALTTGEMPSHSHTGTADNGGAHTHTGSTSTDGAHSHTYNGGQSDGGPWNNGTLNDFSLTNSTSTAGAHSHSVTINSGGAHTHTLTIGNAGDGEPHPNLQPTIIMNKIIKT